MKAKLSLIQDFFFRNKLSETVTAGTLFAAFAAFYNKLVSSCKCGVKRPAALLLHHLYEWRRP